MERRGGEEERRRGGEEERRRGGEEERRRRGGEEERRRWRGGEVRWDVLGERVGESFTQSHEPVACVGPLFTAHLYM